MRRFLTAILLTLILAFSASAEEVDVPWNGNYAHNKDSKWSRKNPYDSGFSRNFNNGAPEEFNKVQKDGSIPTKIILSKEAKGPVPFMLLLHPCVGMSTITKEWMAKITKRLNEEGYGVAIPDSFTPRFVDSSCGQGDLHWGRRRAEDAYSVLDYLVSQKLAKPDQVYVMGYSNGGTTTLVAMTKDLNYHKNRFAAGFAIAPSCISVTLKQGDYYNPLVVFTPEKDESNLAKYCIQLGKKKRLTPVEVWILKGANHGFLSDRAPSVFQGHAMSYDKRAYDLMIDKVLHSLQTRSYARNSTAYK